MKFWSLSGQKAAYLVLVETMWPELLAEQPKKLFLLVFPENRRLMPYFIVGHFFILKPFLLHRHKSWNWFHSSNYSHPECKNSFGVFSLCLFCYTNQHEHPHSPSQLFSV